MIKTIKNLFQNNTRGTKAFKIKLKSYWDDIMDPKKPTWIIIALLLVAISAVINTGESKSHVESASLPLSQQQPRNIDTFVPQGFVLAPLQLMNAESIGAIMGNYGLVDLYATRNDSVEKPFLKGKMIASHVRIVRSPNNPNLFGVLIEETQKTLIQELAYPVFAVIKNPDAKKQPPHPQAPAPKPTGRTIKVGDFL